MFSVGFVTIVELVERAKRVELGVIVETVEPVEPIESVQRVQIKVTDQSNVQLVIKLRIQAALEYHPNSKMVVGDCLGGSGASDLQQHRPIFQVCT